MAWVTVLGIPAGVYIASMTAMLFTLQSQTVEPLAIVGAGLLALGAYIFHRTYTIQTPQMQLRHRLARQHRDALIIISGIVTVASAIDLFFVHPLAPLLLVAVFSGVVLYGRGALVPPIRRITLTKPIAVGVSIAMLAWVLAGMHPHPIPVTAIALLCTADAMLCDLDDRAYDESTQCTTLASRLGTRGSWCLAGTMYFIASAVVMVTMDQLVIGAALLLAFPVPLIFRKFGVRTAIDLRPLLVLLLAWII